MGYAREQHAKAAVAQLREADATSQLASLQVALARADAVETERAAVLKQIRSDNQRRQKALPGVTD